jgi:hypothetical protein
MILEAPWPDETARWLFIGIGIIITLFIVAFAKMGVDHEDNSDNKSADGRH